MPTATSTAAVYLHEQRSTIITVIAGARVASLTTIFRLFARCRSDCSALRPPSWYDERATQVKEVGGGTSDEPRAHGQCGSCCETV
jgi:hypothetical protein